MIKDFQRFIWQDVCMVFLAFLSLALLFLDVFANLTQDQHRFILYLDILISVIFLLEFVFNLFRAPDKLLFFRKYWWELLAAIPLNTHFTQALKVVKLGRLFPLLEVFRVMRFLIRLKMIIDVSNKLTKQSSLIYIALVVGTIILAGAYGFYFFEYQVNPHVKSIWDSIWWALVTTATIGYGDIYPITAGGRVVAVILMFTGIGSLGVLVAVIDFYVFNLQRHRQLQS